MPYGSYRLNQPGILGHLSDWSNNISLISRIALAQVLHHCRKADILCSLPCCSNKSAAGILECCGAAVALDLSCGFRNDQLQWLILCSFSEGPSSPIGFCFRLANLFKNPKRQLRRRTPYLNILPCGPLAVTLSGLMELSEHPPVGSRPRLDAFATSWLMRLPVVAGLSAILHPHSAGDIP
jgi:hypothetical protein